VNASFPNPNVISSSISGYNIVGDGTPQAFIPILTGQTEEELVGHFNF